VLYYDTDAQRQLIREHADQLAREMRSARRPQAEAAAYRRWMGLATELIQRVEPRRRRQAYRAPAYDA
jgi:hypothetical protein